MAQGALCQLFGSSGLNFTSLLKEPPRTQHTDQSVVEERLHIRPSAVTKMPRPLQVMHEFSDQKDVFCKIGSHLGDIDVDPNTPKSENGSFLSVESGHVYSASLS